MYAKYSLLAGTTVRLTWFMIVEYREKIWFTFYGSVYRPYIRYWIYDRRNLGFKYLAKLGRLKNEHETSGKIIF